MPRVEHVSEHFVVRGPGIREARFDTIFERVPAWARAQAYLELRGVTPGAIVHVDGGPACIFCERSRADHVPGAFGEHCRPHCVAPWCARPTCVQALVNGYQPACLHHFFEGKLMRRPDGIDPAIVDPPPFSSAREVLWRREEDLALEIVRRLRG